MFKTYQNCSILSKYLILKPNLCHFILSIYLFGYKLYANKYKDTSVTGTITHFVSEDIFYSLMDHVVWWVNITNNALDLSITTHTAGPICLIMLGKPTHMTTSVPYHVCTLLRTYITYWSFVLIAPPTMFNLYTNNTPQIIAMDVTKIPVYAAMAAPIWPINVLGHL